MSYSIIVQAEAREDLREAYEYYESQKIGLGNAFIIAFRNRATQIEENPFLFQKIYNSKRRAVIEKFGYNIIYEIEEPSVRISAVMHGSRAPRRWKGR